MHSVFYYQPQQNIPCVKTPPTHDSLPREPSARKAPSSLYHSLSLPPKITPSMVGIGNRFTVIFASSRLAEMVGVWGIGMEFELFWCVGAQRVMCPNIFTSKGMIRLGYVSLLCRFATAGSLTLILESSSCLCVLLSFRADHGETAQTGSKHPQLFSDLGQIGWGVKYTYVWDFCLQLALEQV
ncbi:hypothetical protein BGX38DRAFT_1167499 [Terfezia claveryi]|nr:hypothetical protein BGX38DRAFT_1167499 [Terfezia claveryi]